MNTLDTVLFYIRKNNLITPGDRIICGLSGGADSCAMVDILHRLSPTLGISLFCAHLNHGLRGEEARRDELFAENFAKKLGVPFYSETANVVLVAKEKGLSVEDAGRQARYDFFDRIMQKSGGNKIATAHNKNDNAETILMHIVRSSGIKGICGIPPMRGEIIRPVLCLERREIEEYCAEFGVSYITDSTNLETDYTRNKFRLEIIPALEEINPAVTEALCRLGDAATVQQNFIEEETQKTPVSFTENGAEILLDDLKNLHPALYPQLIKTVMEKIAPDAHINTNALSSLEFLVTSGKTTGSTELWGDITARLSYDRLIISETEKTPEFEYKLHHGEILKLYGKQIFIADTIPVSGEFIPWDGTSPVTVRNRRPGDKMKIRNMSRKLQDLFVNMKIDKVLRDKLLIISTGNTVVWTEKVGKDDSVAHIQSEKYIVIKSED